MPKNTTLLATVCAAGVLLATTATAHTGGGGGGGGAGGMGMGMGGGFGGGSNMGHGGGPSGFSNTNFPSRPSVGVHSATTTLNNSSLANALSKAMAKSRVAIPGGDLKTACAGFKSLGQCVAALHVANNLSLPGGFSALKSRTTGQNSVSLGAAIQQLQPSANGAAEEKKANHQAQRDLRSADEDQPG